MARIENGITGGVSGKIGNIVGARWKDISYLRTLPSNWKDPKTKKQVKQRSKLSVVVSFLRTASDLVKIGFQSRANGRMTAFNAAMSYNMKHAVTPMDEGYGLDYEKVMISQGELEGASDARIKVVGNKLVFEWNPSVLTNGSGDDMAMVMVHNTQKCRGISDTDAGKRRVGEASLTLPGYWAGDEMVAYLAFRNAKTTMASDSLFVGKCVLP